MTPRLTTVVSCNSRGKEFRRKLISRGCARRRARTQSREGKLAYVVHDLKILFAFWDGMELELVKI